MGLSSHRLSLFNLSACAPCKAFCGPPALPFPAGHVHTHGSGLLTRSGAGLGGRGLGAGMGLGGRALQLGGSMTPSQLLSLPLLHVSMVAHRLPFLATTRAQGRVCVCSG